jgi:hypothetical protein
MNQKDLQPARRAYQSALSRLEQAIAARLSANQKPPSPTLWQRLNRALRGKS